MLWATASERIDVERKLFASERLLAVALELTGRHLPLAASAWAPPPPGKPVMPLGVFEEFGRATKSCRACLNLAADGFGQAAQVLAAVVAESSLIVLWGVQRGVDTDHLADLHARYGMQLESEARKAANQPGLSGDPYLTDEERDEAGALFGSDATGLWTGHASIMDLADDLIAGEQDPFVKQQLARLKVELEWAMSVRQSTGVAQWSHRRFLELEDGRKAVGSYFHPGPEGVSDALHLAGSTYSSALSAIVEKYVPDLTDELRQAEALAWRAWKDPELLANLRDDDPCPCDKPDTVWGTCHKWTEDLGTVKYVPFTDADTVNFIPYDPNERRRLPDRDSFPTGKSDLPGGPHVVTFAFALPFTLGLEDTGQSFFLTEKWADPNDIGHFGPTPKVLIRLRTEEIDGRTLWFANPTQVLRRFYGDQSDEEPDGGFPSIGKTYEQWVSLETPGARLQSEQANDPAFAFHRCLTVFNLFLAAMDLSVSDLRISTISTHEMGAVVFRGAFTTDRRWVQLGDLIMHPESFQTHLPAAPFAAIEAQFMDSFEGIRFGRPFMLANLWHGRAMRALGVRGDTADGVVSLQTAVESMMYDLLRSILVDDGRTSKEIEQQLEQDIPFKSLLIRELPGKLGGDWDITKKGIVAKYWSSLYLLRNRVVHGGYQPGLGEADEAAHIFMDLREFVSERLWRRWPKYPRTLLAKVGVNGLERRGWMNAKVRVAYAKFKAEALPFYWPRDLAGR